MDAEASPPREILKQYAEILISEQIMNRQQLEGLKREVGEKLGVSGIPSNRLILSLLPAGKREKMRELLKTKPSRTASGIVVITVMTKPHSCPHGTCIFCPGGVKDRTPQSYTRNSPAVLGAAGHRYDPYKQVAGKLAQLSAMGHRVSKAELIVIGGTFSALPVDYQRHFVKGCFDAFNGFDSASLEDAIKANEGVKVRNVGFTVETKPDWCKVEHVDLMLSYGVTRIEVGVQTLREEVYRLVNRGHTLKDVIEAIQICKDSCLKVGVHMMPGLPGTDSEKDLEDLIRLFQDEDFKPDMLKVYPTLVVEGTGLYGWYKVGKYKPYDTDRVVTVLAEAKSRFPYWVRVMRIQREIPAYEIVAGVKEGNLRELVHQELERRGLKCRCIRCREIGLKQLKEDVAIREEDLELFTERYPASGGEEVFISIESKDREALVGFARLRIPSEKAYRVEIKECRCGLIRELHVYGPAIPVGLREDGAWQHKGFGARLMTEAEKLGREEFDVKNVLVISAVGTREYYRKLGYRLEGPYMAKRLN